MKTIIKVPNDALIPKYKHTDDAGADLISPENVIIKPGHWAVIDTLVSFHIPKKTFLAIVSRSGLAAKFGVVVQNGIGIVDRGYSGNVKVILHNHGKKSYAIQTGDRIAQAILMPYVKMKIKKVKKFPKSKRGNNGLGSTGK